MRNLKHSCGFNTVSEITKLVYDYISIRPSKVLSSSQECMPRRDQRVCANACLVGIFIPPFKHGNKV